MCLCFQGRMTRHYKKVQLSYGSGDLVREAVLPGGRRVTYTYDHLDRLGTPQYNCTDLLCQDLTIDLSWRMDPHLCNLIKSAVYHKYTNASVLTPLSSGPERQRRGDRAVLLQPPAAALAGHPGGGGPGEQAHQPRVRRQGPAHLPPDQPGLVLCSAPAVPQPVFTITEKAPTRASS